MPRQNALTFPCSSAVARDDDREGEIRRRQHLRVVQDNLHIAAVGAAHQQEDVRVDRQDLLDVVLGQLEGIHLQHLRARAKTRLTGCFGGQFRHQAAGDHPQSAGC